MSETSSLQGIINDKLQLDRLMEEIDNQLREDGVPIEARPLMAGLMISRRFNCSFSLDSPLGIHINIWFNDRYGDRLKIDLNLGDTVVLIKGDPYKVRFPIAIGINGQVNVLEWIKAATPALLDSLDEKELDDLAEVIIEQQCKPDVRYDEPVELSNAVNAYHSAVKICHHVALHYQ